MRKTNSEIMIVVGEASGDQLGTALAHGLNELAPEVHLFGAAGPKMRAAGVEATFNSDEWSVVGVAAVGKSVPKFLKIKRDLRQLAATRKPAAVVLVDFPEFNLKLAKELKSDGHRVIYYVSPQVWAWRQYRYKTIRDHVDLLLSILPFEKDWYRNKGVDHVEYVGNPIAERIRPTVDRIAFCESYGLEPNATIVALLPGSRKKEIDRHLQTLLAAAALMGRSNRDAQFVIAASDETNSAISHSIVREFNASADEKLSPIIVSGETVNVLNAAEVAAVSSGTATLEAGIIGTPMAVFYRIPRFDAMLFRPFVDVEHFALINLIAGKRIVSELMQGDFTAENVAAELVRILDPDTNAIVRSQLSEATRELREGDHPSAAEAIVKFLNYRSANDLES